jgi:hypothetical protein
MTGLFVVLALAVVVLLVVAKTAVVVPQQQAFVVERLGKYHSTLSAGFHVLLPFVDAIRYRHSLKETAVDIAEQVCITRDNVQVAVDGVLYLKVMDAERASYGVSQYLFAISQLAQTNLRSEVGKIELDRTFEERTHINMMVVSELDKASESWGVKVLRYEIKNITPPRARSSRSSRPRRPRSSSPSTRPKARPPPSSPSPWRRPRAFARWATPSPSPEDSRPSASVSPSSTSTNSGSWPRPATPSCFRPMQPTSAR